MKCVICGVYEAEYDTVRGRACPKCQGVFGLDLVETDSTSNDDNYCVFCGEELETNSNGYIICRNCGYDEGYEKSKLG